MNKQYFPKHIEPIRTDGCHFMVDLSFGESLRQRIDHDAPDMTPDEVNHAYHYAIPDYMEDYREPEKSRCYILSHEEIIAIGLRIMGFRNFNVEYLYRRDGNTYIIGNEAALFRCNFFVKKIPYKSSGHFIRCYMNGITDYNPGNTDSMDILSLRGFLVKIF